MWIPYEKLNHQTCHIALVRFVKSPAKRPKKANLYLNTSFWIEAQLHIQEDMKLRLRWRKKKWGGTKFDCASEPWQRSYCGAVHLSVYINGDKMYSKSKNELREFTNPWLFRQITRKAFE
jgi:hypothetical protein